MEFHEKLQELRKQKGLTQEELAASLYVSRTAVSKWESGRGYPNIDSLKAIADFFSVTVDQLLSTDAVLTIAKAEQKETERYFCDLVFGIGDLSMVLLLLLPLFAARRDGTVSVSPLLTLDGISLWLKITYFFVLIGTVMIGVLTLALQTCHAERWHRWKTTLSVAFGVVAVLLFTVSLQPYAAIVVFFVLAIKVLLLLERK